MSPRVVHCKRAPYDVYIGRPTKWGNPFTLDRVTRDAAIRLYREYIAERPYLIRAARRELRGKTLGCWCAPLPCHGDVLAAIANAPETGDPT